MIDHELPDWVGHPSCESPSEDERKLIDGRDRIRGIGYVNDAEAYYSYDDYALVQFDGAFYLLNTSGCSCPLPYETWHIVVGPASLDAIEAHLRDEAGEKGYGVTKRQHDEFMELVAEARKLTF